MYKNKYYCSVSDVIVKHSSINSKPVIVLILSLSYKERRNMINTKIDLYFNKYFVFPIVDNTLLMKLKIFFIGKTVEVIRVGKGKQHWEISEDNLQLLYNEYCKNN